MTRERITTYGLFCLPGFIAYCVFLIFPILMGIYYSFMDWNGISKGYNFIGFANYAKLLTEKMGGNIADEYNEGKLRIFVRFPDR